MLLDAPAPPTTGQRLRHQVAEIIRRFPLRRAGSRPERRALKFLEQQLATPGAVVERPKFRASRTIYSVLTLHLGVAAGASLLCREAPLAAAGLHLLAGVSYWLDSTYRFALLRRLLPHHASRNLLVTHPATSELKRRIVLVGHVDASPTGWMFTPFFTQLSASSAPPWPFGFLRRQMQFFVYACWFLTLMDLIYWRTGQHLPLFAFGALVGFMIGLVLNLQVLLKNALSPGASDNLTGCVAVVELAQRLAADKPADVELVFAITSGEEPGSLGSAALVRQKRAAWGPAETRVLALDCLTGGELTFKYQSEITPLAPAPKVLAAVRAAERTLGVAPLKCWDAPVGMDDSTPFRLAGYESLCLACVDPALGVSRHYHQVTDTAENLDAEQFERSVDFAEAVARELMAPDEPPAAAPLAEADYTPPRLSTPHFGPAPLPKLLVLGALTACVAWFWTSDISHPFAAFRISWWLLIGWFGIGFCAQLTGRDVNRHPALAAVSGVLSLAGLALFGCVLVLSAVR